MARRIDYYFTLNSPWSCLGHRLFNDLAIKHKLKVVYKPTPFGEVFAQTGGQPLPQRHPVRQRYRWVELQRWRDKRGVPLNLKPKYWPVQSTLAERCVIVLDQMQHDPNTFVTLAFKTIWEKELNLADDGIVATILSASGLDGPAIIAKATSEATEAAFRANRDDAVAAGAFGAPSYVIDGEVFWGQDRLELLDDMLTSGRAPYQPL